MTDYSELKRLALAAQENPGYKTEMALYSECSPATLLALIAENERLREERDSQQRVCIQVIDERDQIKAEVSRIAALNHKQFGDAIRQNADMDALKAEVEALRFALRRVEKCTDGAFMVDGKWQVGDNVMNLVRRTLWPKPAPGGAVAEWQESATDELEALRKDAERLQFIEREWFFSGPEGIEFSFNETWHGEGISLADAIDAAMTKEQG